MITFRHDHGAFITELIFCRYSKAVCLVIAVRVREGFSCRYDSCYLRGIIGIERTGGWPFIYKITAGGIIVRLCHIAVFPADDEMIA